MKKARSPNGTRKPRVLSRSQRIAHNLRGRERYLERKIASAPVEKKPSVVEIKRATRARVVAAKMVEDPSLSVGEAIRAVGLPESMATHPAQVVNTPEWNELLDQMLPRGELLATHKGLLRASRIDHMIFADGPKTAEDGRAWIAARNEKLKPSDEPYTIDDALTDDDIRAMLEEKNCTVRRISRTENSRHVYFWSPDNKARQAALDSAYKLRGDFAADKAAVAFSLVALANSQREAARLDEAQSTPQLPKSI